MSPTDWEPFPRKGKRPQLTSDGEAGHSFAYVHQRETMAAVLTQELASRFARIALGHVTREYPNKPGHILRGPEDARTPRELHPLFFGSFDWHSCVHGYWLLSRLHRRFPELAERGEIQSLLDRQFTPENVLAEL